MNRTQSVALAIIMLTISLGLAIAQRLDLIGNGIADRVFGAVIGIMLAVYGNAVPKNLERLEGRQCRPSRIQSFQRFAGWTMVVTGLLYAAVWIILPSDIGKPVSTVILGTMVLLLAPRLAWCLLKRSPKPQAETRGES